MYTLDFFLRFLRPTPAPRPFEAKAKTLSADLEILYARRSHDEIVALFVHPHYIDGSVDELRLGSIKNSGEHEDDYKSNTLKTSCLLSMHYSLEIEIRT